MDTERPSARDESEAQSLVEGVIFASLLSIPLWAVIAAVAIALFQESPLTALQSVAFTIAAAVEVILLRHVSRKHGLTARIRAALARSVLPADRRSMIKQAAFLGGLVAAYLHYYLWDVQLQIAQLNRVTVFI